MFLQRCFWRSKSFELLCRVFGKEIQALRSFWTPGDIYALAKRNNLEDLDLGYIFVLNALKFGEHETKLITLSRVVLEKLILRQLTLKFIARYGTRQFITVFSRASPHLFLSWARTIQSMCHTHPISWRSVLRKTILFLRLSLSSGLFPSDFQTLHACLVSAMHAT